VRPKTLKKPSKERLERAAKKAARRESYQKGTLLRNDFTERSGSVGWTGTADYFTPISTAVTTAGTGEIYAPMITNGTANATIVYPHPSQQGIESLDEGLTWHTADTMEPVANRDGHLVIGCTLSGPAPACMTPGSGTYRFEITHRMATATEAHAWHAEYAASGRVSVPVVEDLWPESLGTNPVPELEAELQEIMKAKLAESQAKLAAQAEERERVWKETQEKRKKAETRARELLLSHLTKTQKADLETKEGFWVISQSKSKYWVTRSTAVRFDERGSAIQRYCIHAVDPEIPADDNALTRKILLECDEERFLNTANPGSPGAWDFERRNRQVPMINAGAAIQDYVVGPAEHRPNPPRIRVATILGFNPVLIYVNGVVRPLTG
jgi:hypothetical protein